MDNKDNENQDIVVGDDGSMNKDVDQENQSIETTANTIEVKTEDTEADESVNQTTPPPDDPIVEDKNDSDTTVSETAEDAVNFIAGTQPSKDAPNNELPSENYDKTNDQPQSVNDSEENDGEVVQAPIENNTGSDEEIKTPENTVNMDKNTAEVVAQPDKNGMSNNENNSPHEHRNNRKLALVVTLLVAILLSGAAIYAYLSAQSNTEESKLNPSSSPVEVQESSNNEVTPATQNDIDETINDIDQTMESLDGSDISEDSISDETLGL